MKKRCASFVLVTCILLLAVLLMNSKRLPQAKVYQNEPFEIGLKTNSKKALCGYNIFSLHEVKKAYLLNLKGEIIHKWQGKGKGGWYHVETDPDGNLYAISPNKSFEKLDFNSNLLWKVKGGFHHDFDFTDTKQIYTMERALREIDYNGIKTKIVDDYVTLLDQNGKKLSTFSIFDYFKQFVRKVRLEKISKLNASHKFDQKKLWEIRELFHLNSLHIVKKSVAGIAKKGELLLGLPREFLIATFDPITKKIRWHKQIKGNRLIHDAQFTDTGNILYFDNGIAEKSSKIIEFNPVVDQVLWLYSGTIFSKYRGRNQRLSNGNTLITSSYQLRAIEVTPNKEIVWDLNLMLPKKFGLTTDVRRLPQDFFKRHLSF